MPKKNKIQQNVIFVLLLFIVRNIYLFLVWWFGGGKQIGGLVVETRMSAMFGGGNACFGHFFGGLVV